MLQTLKLTGLPCGDLIVFGFRPDNGAPPNCSVAYKAGPFTQDASGKPVQIAGTAFLRVRCEPARSYDPETGVTTYKAPKQISTAGLRRVVGMASTGDFEGVMSWVIGVNGRLPFHAAATADGRLVIGIF